MRCASCCPRFSMQADAAEGAWRAAARGPELANAGCMCCCRATTAPAIPACPLLAQTTDGFSGLNGGWDTAGSGHNLLVHNMCRLPGADGTWMVVAGGMGAVTQRLAAAAMRAGAKIHTGRPVERCAGSCAGGPRVAHFWQGARRQLLPCMPAQPAYSVSTCPPPDISRPELAWPPAGS